VTSVNARKDAQALSEIFMPKILIELVDAFVDHGAGGNIAGVVFEGAADLSPEQRQDVARQVAMSEIAFALPSASADFKLEFYTPTRLIPHCGHATVGIFARLAEACRFKSADVINETVDGPRRIRIEGGRAFLEQVPARFEGLGEAMTGEIVASLGIDRAQLRPDGGPFMADNGNKLILIGVASGEVLSSLRPDMDSIRGITNRFDAVCYYVFALDTVVPGRDATGHIFGPAYGIPEESATGMAAGPLACWLDVGTARQRRSFTIEQGQFMDPPSPSVILARPQRSGDWLAAMWIGGSAKARGVRQVAVS
jgi:PhzF family phenazine biosynthesis protein